MIKTSAWVFFFTSCSVENIEYHYLHSLNYFNVKLKFAFSCVSSGRLPTKMQSHISCICFFFLHCALSSNRLIQWRHSHIGYICLAFPHCELSNESSNCISEKIHNYTGCIFWIFLQCVLKYFFQI